MKYIPVLRSFTNAAGWYFRGASNGSWNVGGKAYNIGFVI